MAEVYINGDADLIHAPDSNDDVINNEEILPKHDILAQGHIKASPKDLIDIEGHDDELNADSKDSGINVSSTYDINDNSEVCNSVASEEESSSFSNSTGEDLNTFPSTNLHNDSSVVQNEVINEQLNISDIINRDDISDINEHEKNNDDLNIKTDNVKLAANFQNISSHVPNEIISTTSEDTTNNGVLEPSDEVAAIIDSSDSIGNSDVSSINVESVLSEDDLSAIKMSDSHIKTVDNIALTESYVKISLDGNSEDTSSDSTDIVTEDSEVTIDFANHDIDQVGAGSVELNAEIVNEDTSDSKGETINEEAVTNFVADIIEFAKSQHTSLIETEPVDNEQITVESISELEACKDDLEEIPVIDLTHESTTFAIDDVLDKEATSAIIESEVIDLTMESIGDVSSPMQIIDSTIEIVDDTKPSIKVEEAQIIDGLNAVPAEVVESSSSDDKILDTSVENIVDLTSITKDDSVAEVIDPAEVVETSTSNEKIIDTSVENIVDLTSITKDDSVAEVIDSPETRPSDANDVNIDLPKLETVLDSAQVSNVLDSAQISNVTDAAQVPNVTVAAQESVVSDPAKGSDVVAETSDTPEDEWLDILGNDLLKKKVIVKGKGKESRPPSGSIVNVRCEGKLADGTVVDKHDNVKFILSDEDVIQAFDLAVALMEDKETALVFTDPRYAYGIQGRSDFVPPIPQNASITYEIEILSVEDGPDLEKMSDEQRLIHGDQKRIRGNDMYAREEYSASINSYKRGVKYLEGSDDKNVMSMKIKCLNNLSAAQLKVKAYKMAVQSLDTVLQFEPENVKALFRKGKCLDGMKKEEEALECIKKASMLDPNNKSILQELGRLRSRVAVTHQKEKQMYQKMFTQKKEEKISKEEEELNWSLKLSTGIVAILGICFATLWYKNR